MTLHSSHLNHTHLACDLSTRQLRLLVPLRDDLFTVWTEFLKPLGYFYCIIPPSTLGTLSLPLPVTNGNGASPSHFLTVTIQFFLSVRGTDGSLNLQQRLEELAQILARYTKFVTKQGSSPHSVKSGGCSLTIVQCLSKRCPALLEEEGHDTWIREPVSKREDALKLDPGLQKTIQQSYNNYNI